MNFCLNIFNNKSYTITDVSVTYKKYIAWWVAVRKRVVETQDSRGAGGEPYNSRSHVPTGPNTHIHNHTPVDGYGKHTPKIICFMKACNGHTQGIFLTFKPEKLQYL